MNVLIELKLDQLLQENPKKCKDQVQSSHIEIYCNYVTG